MGINNTGTSTTPVVDGAVVSVRVGNHSRVTLEPACPLPNADPPDPDYNKKIVRFGLDATHWADDALTFGNGGLLKTVLTIGELAGVADDGTSTADIEIEACGDKAGFADPEITLTILDRNLVEPPGGRDGLGASTGDVSVGPPLMITVESDEAAPTLSFSPTDVEIDEGGSTSTVLLAEGPNADEVGMVKLSVEGDAMVSLMQDGEMLEEMGGYVYVDLDGNSSARLTAMSHSDPDLMDGDMAFKAWKLMEGGTDGANIGEGYWFKVDVRGSTAVPALPLLGQLLLALFLMAGGARLYRRRQG